MFFPNFPPPERFTFMEYRDNTYANKAGRRLGFILIMVVNGAWLLYTGYNQAINETGSGSLVYAMLCFVCAFFLFMLLVPATIVEVARLMGQAIREDNELGLEKPKMTRAEAGRAVLEDRRQ